LRAGRTDTLTLYDLKPRFQALLRPAVARLARAGVTANQVTLAAAAGSVAIGLGVGRMVAGAPEYRLLFLAIPAWLLVRMSLNAVDGMLAREHGQASRRGAYLNEIGDLVSDAALYAPFALVPPFGPHGLALVILSAWLTEVAGILGPTVGASRRYDGPFGKSDRALAFGALGLWIGLAGTLPGWAGWIVPAMIALLAVTVARRVRAGLAEAAGRTAP